MGRPKKPQEEVRDVRLGTYVTQQESRLVGKFVNSSAFPTIENTSDFVRAAVEEKIERDKWQLYDVATLTLFNRTRARREQEYLQNDRDAQITIMEGWLETVQYPGWNRDAFIAAYHHCTHPPARVIGDQIANRFRSELEGYWPDKVPGIVEDEIAYVLLTPELQKTMTYASHLMEWEAKKNEEEAEV